MLAAADGEPYDVRRARLDELGLSELPHVGGAALLHGRRARPADRGDAGASVGGSGDQTARYGPGRRSAAWVKTALLTAQEVVVGGWAPGQGCRAGMIGALMLGAHDEHGRLRYLGHVGTGFTDATLRRLATELAHLAQPGSGFDDTAPTVEVRAAHWVRPVLVGGGRLSNPGPDRPLRHAAWCGCARTAGPPRSFSPFRDNIWPAQRP